MKWRTWAIALCIVVKTLSSPNLVHAERVFSEINAGLPGGDHSSVAWGDYDGDGYLDILITGRVTSDYKISKIYRNNGNGSFTDINAV